RFFSPALQEEVITGFSTVPKVGWGVMIPQPLSELAAHVSRVQHAVWSVIGIALLCTALLGVLVSRWLATPLRRIGLVAERFDDGELQARGEDGQPVYVAIPGRPISDAAEGIVGYRGVTRDITARLYAEEQLRQAQQDAQRRQAQKMEAIGVLAGGIAHDFNNILSAILGYTDLALQEVASRGTAAQYLQAVLTAGRRAQSLVLQILTFSRASEPERIP